MNMIFFFLGKISEESGIAIKFSSDEQEKNSKEMFYKRGTFRAKGIHFREA